MLIDLLADHPEHIDALASAMLEHWRYAQPEDTLETRTQELRRHLNRDALPIAWVAHDTKQVLGTAALRQYDLEDRQDLTPWLAGVLVLPAFRRQGIAAALCGAVERFARRAGVETVYLYTLDRQRLYAALGWRLFERAPWRGYAGDIMRKNLAHRRTADLKG